MDIVGQSSSEAEAEAQAEEEEHRQTWFDEPGEWDAYLVTEPEGADPRWAQGTEHYLAGLQHNVVPPVPVPVPASSASTAAVSIPAVVGPSAKAKGKGKAVSSSSLPTSEASKSAGRSITSRQQQQRRRENIDYLFPFQAEQRASEAAARKLAEEASLTQPSRMPEDKLKPYRPAEALATVTTSGDLASGTVGVRFLLSQLVKNQWAGMWDFERVAKALQAALAKKETHGPPAAVKQRRSSGSKLPESAISAAATSEAGAGTGHVAAAVNDAGASAAAEQARTAQLSPQTQKETTQSTSRSLDQLSSASKKQALLRAKRQRSAATAAGKAGVRNRGSGTSLERLLTEALEESGARVAVFSFDENGQATRIGGTAGKERQQAGAKDGQAAMMLKEEMARVVNQVKRFQGFFDKSVEDSDFERREPRTTTTSSGSSSSGISKGPDAALRRLEERFGSSRLETDLDESIFSHKRRAGGGIALEVHWDAPPPGTRVIDELDVSEYGLRWAVPSDSSSISSEAVAARWAHGDGAMGSRLSQSTRGRSLRPTLRDRMVARGVELQEIGEITDGQGWFADSVKRKRRKRISKHK